jgi:hypothetical protein
LILALRFDKVNPLMPKKNPHAVALGQLGGLSKSANKTAAVRLNGKKGGRPKKVLDKQTA